MKGKNGLYHTTKTFGVNNGHKDLVREVMFSRSSIKPVAIAKGNINWFREGEKCQALKMNVIVKLESCSVAEGCILKFENFKPCPEYSQGGN